MFSLSLSNNQMLFIHSFLHPSCAYSPKTSLRAGGTHLAVLARSVMSYLNVSLESGDLDKVSKSLNMQTTRALMAIFK